MAKQLRKRLEEEFGEGMKVHDNMTIDVFGDIIDNFLKSEDIRMMVWIPKGTDDVGIKDNIGAGSVVEFYIMIKALSKLLIDMIKDMGLLPNKRGDFLDGVLDLVKDDVMKATEGGGDE